MTRTTATPVFRVSNRPVESVYAAASGAEQMFRRDPIDWAALTTHVECLAELGLGGAARRFLERAAQSARSGSNQAAALNGVLSAIESAPRGVVPWSFRRGCFSANVAALRKRFPDAAEAVTNAASRLSAFELCQGTDRNYQVLDLTAMQWRPGLGNHVTAAAEAFRGGGLEPEGPALFDGVGMGYLLGEFARRSRRVFLSYSAAVSVVEPDALAFAIALHLHDWVELFGEERVGVYVGEDAAKRYTAMLDNDVAWPLPRYTLRHALLPREAFDFEGALMAVRERRRAREQRLQAGLAKWLSGRDVAAWRERFAAAMNGDGPPLRVLGITSRFTTVLQYSMRSLVAAAGRAGCVTRLAMEPSDCALAPDVQGEIDSFRPDLVILLSRMRYEAPSLPDNMPLLSWDQDNLPTMRTKQAGHCINRLTFVAGHGALLGRLHRGWPASQTLPAAPAAATDVYHDGPIDETLLRRHACDLSFVSHCSEEPAAMRERLATYWRPRPELERVFRDAAARIVERSAEGANWMYVDLVRLIREAAGRAGISMGVDLIREMYMSCASLADRAFRHCALNWARRFVERTGRTLRLYGNGWENHPQLGRFAAGPAAFGEELRAVYRASRINLQMMETGFVHSRTLDGLSAGGFFLSRTTRYDTSTGPLQVVARQVRATGSRDAAALRSSDDPAVRAAMKALADDVDWSDDAVWRFLETIEDRPDPYAVLPEYARTTFHDYESFAERVEAFLSDEPARRDVAGGMRAVVNERFSYDARWDQFMRFIRDSLNAV